MLQNYAECELETRIFSSSKCGFFVKFLNFFMENNFSLYKVISRKSHYRIHLEEKICKKMICDSVYLVIGSVISNYLENVLSQHFLVYLYQLTRIQHI